MNKELNKLLQSYDSMNIQPEDIQQTIQIAKQIVRTVPIQKHETNIWKQMMLILRIHFPRIFILQLTLSLFLLLVMYQQLHFDLIQTTMINHIDLYIKQAPTLMIGGILSSIITGIEILRNRVSGMWEYEKVCMIRLEKVIAFKLYALTISTFLILGGLCIILSLQIQEIDAFPLFVIAILPYICTTTCIVQFIQHLKTIQAILCVYGSMSFIFIGLFSIDTAMSMQIFLQYCGVYLLIASLYSICIITKKLILPAER